MKQTIIVFLLCLMGACSHQSAQLQFNQQGLRKLTGSPEEDVIEKLGEPAKSYTQDGQKFLVYTTTYQSYTAPIAQPYNSPGMPSDAGFYTPETCVTVFKIVSQVVQDVTTTGNCL